MGRKPLPIDLSRNRRVAIMLTEAEYELIEKARERLGYGTISEMARDALKEIAARRRKP